MYIVYATSQYYFWSYRYALTRNVELPVNKVSNLFGKKAQMIQRLDWIRMVRVF